MPIRVVVLRGGSTLGLAICRTPKMSVGAQWRPVVLYRGVGLGVGPFTAKELPLVVEK